MMPDPGSAAAQDDAFRNVKALLSKTELAFEELAEGNGFRLSLHSREFNLDPVLIAGADTVWLLVAFPGNWLSIPRENVLDVINGINCELPFGVLYMKDSRVMFRNAIRNLRLEKPEDLIRFVVVSVKLVDDFSTKLKRIIS